MEPKDVTGIGSRRHSLGESSVEGSRSFTPQSDSRSYRDRLRDRFQTVRVSWYFSMSYHLFFVSREVLTCFVFFMQERAGSSVVEMHTRSHLRHRRLNQSGVSHFDDFVSRILTFY
jgi:hypothetical protein